MEGFRLRAVELRLSVQIDVNLLKLSDSVKYLLFNCREPLGAQASFFGE